MRLFLTFGLMAFLASSPAFAQAESQLYDPTFKGNTSEAAQAVMAQKEKIEAQQGFKAPSTIDVSMVHHAYMEPDQVGIQMSVPDVVSGCFDISPLEYEANYIDPYYLDIKVKKYRMTMPEGRADIQKCDRQNKMSTALMVIDKQDIESRGTQEIRFSSDAGRDTYKIVLGEQDITLIPQTMTVFQPQGLTGELKDRLVYNFAGKDTIVLQVPMAKVDDDIKGAIETFATSRALKPLESSAIEQTQNGTMLFYYKDDGGRFGTLINENGYAELGTISVMRPYDGPNGRTQTPVDLSVFVTRPGTQL